MTGATPVLDRPALRDALSHMRIASPDGIPFEEALAWENDWPLAFADRVADEYCGFLYLAATAGFEVTPSEFVDRAWHLHLAWPHYRDVLCGHILGRPLEHRPGTGEPGEEERYRGQYERTLDLYEEAFGRPPPADIWPWPAAGEPDDELASPRSRRIGAVAAVACIAGSLISQAFGFGLLGALFAVAGLFCAFLLVPRRRKRGGGDGADCGGGEAGSCGSSCGGGGCGGD